MGRGVSETREKIETRSARAPRLPAKNTTIVDFTWRVVVGGFGSPSTCAALRRGASARDLRRIKTSATRPSEAERELARLRTPAPCMPMNVDVRRCSGGPSSCTTLFLRACRFHDLQSEVSSVRSSRLTRLFTLSSANMLLPLKFWSLSRLRASAAECPMEGSSGQISAAAAFAWSFSLKEGVLSIPIAVAAAASLSARSRSARSTSCSAEVIGFLHDPFTFRLLPSPDSKLDTKLEPTLELDGEAAVLARTKERLLFDGLFDEGLALAGRVGELPLSEPGDAGIEGSSGMPWPAVVHAATRRSVYLFPQNAGTCSGKHVLGVLLRLPSTT